MKVFVGGATGALGRPLLAALRGAGHTVVGMSRSEEKARELRALGVEAAVVDALDQQSVEAAVKKARPQAVIDELTSLPKRYAPEEMKAAAQRDRTLRLEGGRILQNAAQAAGARRYIVQSTGFFYGPGAGLAVETDALALQASPAVAGSARTYAQIEERVLGATSLEGVALRYGFFYGPGTWFHPEGSMADTVRRRQSPVVGAGQGVWSWVHIEDAAAATVAALNAAPGVYNIVDDHPCAQSVWLPAFASYVGAPEPPRMTEAEALKTTGPDSVYYATQLRGASNAKAKGAFRFAPRRLEWL